MPRLPRLVVPDYPHHVTQRGNRRQQVFFSDADYQQYLLWMTQYARRAGTKVWAYCLMPNHVHLVVVPHEADGLAEMLGPLHSQYAQFINTREQWPGHLWQERYRSTVMDDDYLIRAVRYVERNPVRAGLVRRAEHYAWSSAQEHCGLRTDPALSADLPLIGMVGDWSAWVAVEQTEQELADLRQRTERGLPAGSSTFVGKVRSPNMGTGT